jgi:hypothetical protein
VSVSLLGFTTRTAMSAFTEEFDLLHVNAANITLQEWTH